MATAPVSPLGQRFFVPTKDAVAVASPTTLGVDPLRVQLPENEEQPIPPLYGFLFVADSKEGLEVIGNPNLKAESPGVGTLLDGNPPTISCNGPRPSIPMEFSQAPVASPSPEITPMF